MTLTTNQENTLATAKYRTKERLYIVGYPQVWTGRVNMASPARGVQEVIYDGGAIVSPFVFATDGVEAGLLVWFGTTAGDSDIGQARLIVDLPALVSGTMTIHWHDDIQLVDDAYITVVQVYVPAPKFSHFTVATSVHKDGPPASLDGAGIAYSDQNEEPPPDVIMGPPLVAYDPPTDGLSGYAINGSDSKVMAAGASVSFSWSIIPASLGTIVGASLASTAILPDTHGIGYLKLEVTDTTNGNSSVGYRRIILEDPANPIHISEYALGSISQAKGSYNIGLSVSLTSPDASATGKGSNLDTDYSDIGALSEVIITRDDYFDGTAQYINDKTEGRYDDRDNIVYAGYITSQRQTFNNDGSGQIDLQCNQAAMAMHLFSQSITGSPPNAVNEWYQMTDSLMITEQLSFHLLKWHSTLKEIIDVHHPRNDTVLRAAMDEWTEGDLMQRLASSVGEKGRLMDVTAAPDGSIIIEPYLNLSDATDRAAASTIMDLQQRHLFGEAVADEQLVPTVSQVRIDGFQSPTGRLGDGVPMRSISGNLRLYYGQNSQEIRGLVVEDQTTLNYISGRLLQLANDKIELTATFSGAFWNVFQVANQKWVNSTTALAGTRRANLSGRTDLENINLQPIRITHNPSIGGTGTVEVTFETELPDGLPGRTVPIPTITPAYVVENPLPPTLVSPPVPDAIIATADDTNGFEIYNGAEWETRNKDAFPTDVRRFHLVPFWWRRQLSSNPDNSIWYFAEDQGLYYSEDGAQTWIDKSPTVTSLPTGYDQSDVNWIDVDTYPDSTAVGKIVWAAAYVLDTGTYTSYLFYSEDYGTNWSQGTMTTGDRIISISANKETSSQVWIAFRDDSAGTLQVGQRDSDFATVGTDESFGDATNAELDNGTYRIRVLSVKDETVTNYGSRPFVYGEFQK